MSIILTPYTEILKKITFHAIYFVVVGVERYVVCLSKDFEISTCNLHKFPCNENRLVHAINTFFFRCKIEIFIGNV